MLHGTWLRGGGSRLWMPFLQLLRYAQNERCKASYCWAGQRRTAASAVTCVGSLLQVRPQLALAPTYLMLVSSLCAAPQVPTDCQSTAVFSRTGRWRRCPCSMLRAEKAGHEPIVPIPSSSQTANPTRGMRPTPPTWRPVHCEMLSRRYTYR